MSYPSPSTVSRLGFVLLLGAVAMGSFAPHLRVWGFHFLAYYSPAIQLAVWCAAALVLLLWSRRPQWLEGSGRAAGGVAIWAAGLTVVFIAFAAATPLLGDGQLWINGIRAQAVNYAHSREPLTLLLYHASYAALAPLGLGAAMLVKAMSILSGFVAVLAWLYAGRVLRLNRLTTLLICGCWGGVELFCGYAETYAPMVAAASWLIVLMICSLQRGQPVWSVYVLAALCVALSYISVTFIPAVLAYAWWHSRRTVSTRILFSIVAATFAAAAAVYFALGWYRGGMKLLPLFACWSPNGQAVLTGIHGLDLLNDLVLESGLFLVLAAIFCLDGVRNRQRWTVELSILSLLLIFPLAARIMHHPELGMARDWDIGAALMVGVPPLSLLLWNRLNPARRQAGLLRALAIIWILVLILPWLGVQASEARSRQRFQDLLAMDPWARISGLDYLASYDLDRNDIDNWAQCNRDALRLSGNPRYASNLAYYEASRNRWSDAAEYIHLARTAIDADSVESEWERQVSDPVRIVALARRLMDQYYLADAMRCLDLAVALAPHAVPPRLMRYDLLLSLDDYSPLATDLAALDSDAALRDSLRIYYEGRLPQAKGATRSQTLAMLSLIYQFSHQPERADSCLARMDAQGVDSARFRALQSALYPATERETHDAR